MNDREMTNNNKHEFEVWQQHWKANEDKPGLEHLESRVREKMRLNKRSPDRPRLFVVALLWTSGLLLMATYRHHLHGNHLFLALAVALLIVAAWFGSSTFGPDPISERPEDYVRLRTRSKAREMRRTRIAQVVAVGGLMISLLATWLVWRGGLPSDALEEELLPIGVLLVTMIATGTLVVVRANRGKELANLRELQRQFERVDAPPPGVPAKTGNEDGKHTTAE
jgi:hypothetical protein